MKQTKAASLTRGICVVICLLLVACFSRSAEAQFDEYRQKESSFVSPDNYNLEIHVGMYQPSDNESVDTFFSGDNGPHIAGEFAYMPYRIPYVGRVGASIQFGWAGYSGKTIDVETGAETDESTDLQLFPIPLMAVLQVDALARQFGIPFYLTGKVGLDMIPWTGRGGNSDGGGVAFGFRWAAQVALELDWIEPKKARALDDDWGINHTYLYFEGYGSTAEDSGVNLGDNFAWDAGLGFAF